MTATILHVLPLFDHAEGFVIEVNYLDRQCALFARSQFLNVHLDTAFSRDTRNGGFRESQLHTHCCGQTETHRSQAARIDPTPRLVEMIILGCEHLMLTNVRGN